jgi:hypothetical protein
VRIGLVAVHTLLECQRLLEISVSVALSTIDSGVLALQRELGLGVVEALVHTLQRNFLPCIRVVARLAALRKAPVVRVLVAIGALVERNTRVLRLAVSSIHVALGALHLSVQSGQRKARLGVIKLGLTGLADIDRFPVDEIVTLLASLPQAAFVLIFMAGNAAGREAEVGPGRILDLDGRAFLRRDVRRFVALIARQASVLAFEQVSRVFVIEGVDVPLNQREVFPVVLGVAAGAFLAGAGRDIIGGVQAFASRKAGRDFGVTVQTLQRRLPAELVATGAVGGSVQRLVRPREWSGRDLRRSRGQQREIREPEKCGDAERQAAYQGLPGEPGDCLRWLGSKLRSQFCLAPH